MNLHCSGFEINEKVYMVYCAYTNEHCGGLERWPPKRKVGCSHSNRDRTKS